MCGEDDVRVIWIKVRESCAASTSLSLPAFVPLRTNGKTESRRLGEEQGAVDDHQHCYVSA